MTQAPSTDGKVTFLRKLALVEGSSFLVILFVTMPLKYGLEIPTPNMIFGMLHGVLFVLYVSVLLYVWASKKWSFRVLLWGLAASIVPFLVFWVEKRIFSKL